MGTVKTISPSTDILDIFTGIVPFHPRMKQILLLLSLTVAVHVVYGEDEEGRQVRNLNVFNVVSFPNSECAAVSGYNGTCYTASECSSLGGSASGTCASSFGVCCVFSIACGSSSSANNSYAVISSYSTSTDSDPCTYTFCKTNTDVCKLRIDFDTMVLSAPSGVTTPADTAQVYADSVTVGDCTVDSLTVSNPGGPIPPTICGYNTGQHMFVPASPQCNQINIDIDTGTTTTTRKWQIKVTQYECGNMMAPEQDCLQYLTATSGTIASFNWDTSSSTASQTQYHLSSQYYDICIRRARSYCSICYSPQIYSATAVSSYGLGAGSVAATQTNAIDSNCPGTTTLSTTAASNNGRGDYLDITALQTATGTSGLLSTATAHRICGSFFSISPTTGHSTLCSFAVPFKVGVHFDADDAICDIGDAAAARDSCENDKSTGAAPVGAGYGYSGFYLAYWQNSC